MLGATSWGVTLADLLHRNGHSVTILTRDEAEAQQLRAIRRLQRLPEVVLPPAVAFAPASAALRCDGYVVAVPAQHMAASLVPPLRRNVPVLSAAKGIALEGGLRMSELLEQAGWRPSSISVLSGPNLAHEVARGLPAAAVVASVDPALAARWQVVLSNDRFRVYTSSDVVGVELAGAVKNVIAVAAGAAAGLGLGANSVAAIVTRGLAEMTRLGVALGADALTFQGLAGVGDLAATCFSPLSRNHRLGELLAAGKTPAEAAAAIGEAIEGAASAPVALQLAARAGVAMPITEQVAAVLAGEADLGEALRRLLDRPLREESATPREC